MKSKVIEVTKENKTEYVDQIAELEEKVLEAMEKDGRTGQLFITGKEDIESYVDSKENTVMIATDEENKVISAAYITQGQVPFTYNDITKYFKYGDSYKEYVKSLYSSDEQYKKDMIDIYQEKMEAYKYAKSKMLEENSQYTNINSFLQHEIDEDGNGFHEKSVLREGLNKYMSEYIAKKSEEQGKENLQSLYEKFYWITSDEISKEFGRDIKNKNEDVIEYDSLIKNEQSEEYSNILNKGQLEIHEEPIFDEKKYYKTNTKNAVEIDTYITDPNSRHSGIARILVYKGIKKHMENHFSNPKNDEIFLCSTLHRDNLSSKYVSEFFGLKDNLFVKRRQGRDREVHICKVSRENAKEYLENMSDKLAVLYGYNPQKRNIPADKQVDIIQEQLRYEQNELNRLNKIKKFANNYTGNVRDVQSKETKVRKLSERLSDLKLEQQNFEKSNDENNNGELR